MVIELHGESNNIHWKTAGIHDFKQDDPKATTFKVNAIQAPLRLRNKVQDKRPHPPDINTCNRTCMYVT